MNTLSPGFRKLALTAHVSASVGWFGAVAAFLALAVAGLTSADPQKVRAAYLAMDLTGWWVIVPASLASLPTGLVMSLGTRWGLFQHYWVVAKLLINVVAVLLLLLHMQPTGRLAAAASETAFGPAELRGLRIQLVADALRTESGEGPTTGTPGWVHGSAILLALLILVFAVMHLTGGGLGAHSGAPVPHP